jgi:dihydropteroate synthase
MQLACGSRCLDLQEPLVMGILNTTPDSFSDGCQFYQQEGLSLDLAIRRAEQMLNEGASIIDIGGESTRPGAKPVSEQQELDRVIPVVEAVVRRLDAVVSVDTSTPSVMRESAAVGAGMINDVRALLREGALTAAAAAKLPVCLMHMQGEPGNMQERPSYDDVVLNVVDFLKSRIAACHLVGIPDAHILLDPGFGFGKTLEHNLTLLSHLAELKTMGYPLLVGLSRKSLLGTLLKREVAERLPGSLALALIAAQRGAAIVRVHDVAATVDALKVLAAVKSSEKNQNNNPGIA